MKNVIKNISLNVFLVLISLTKVNAVIDLNGDYFAKSLEKSQLPVIVHFYRNLSIRDRVKKELEKLEKDYKSTYIFAQAYYLSPLGRYTYDAAQRGYTYNIGEYADNFALFYHKTYIGTFPAVSKDEIMAYVHSIQTTGLPPLNYQLIQAIRQDNIKEIQILLKKGANPNYILKTYQGHELNETTPLFAVPESIVGKEKSVAIIHLLLEAGANPYMKIKIYSEEEEKVSFYEKIEAEFKRAQNETTKSPEAFPHTRYFLQQILNEIQLKTGYLQSIKNKVRTLQVRLRDYLLNENY